MAEDSPRKRVALMFSDMVGYSARSQENETLALELLEEHQSLLWAQFAAFQGREIKALGEGFLVEFASARYWILQGEPDQAIAWAQRYQDLAPYSKGSQYLMGEAFLNGHLSGWEHPGHRRGRWEDPTMVRPSSRRDRPPGQSNLL